MTLRLLTVLCFSIAFSTYSQTNISGVINDYTEVTNVNMASNSIIVSSVTDFSVGDKVLMIQMQGATIDESQANTFGDILDYGSAGNYEFQEICSINGSTIYFEFTMLNSYDSNGKVQLISVPTYTDALISGADLTAQPWNGSTGGVLVFDVEGTLDFGSQNIDVSEQGFVGGQAVPSGAGCVFLEDQTYYSDLTSVDETALKGEGIALQISTKECGRGPQANGGGGGNNHNGGGSGGANYGYGGAGGQRIKSSTFTCGSVVGMNSKDLSPGYANGKIFLGGGGGAGHGNNAGIIGESGLNGGGIVIITAGTIVGNNNTILANGGSATVNTEGEGGGAGGAGGTVLIDAQTISSALNVTVNGGDGTSIENIGTSNCNGPGGGGGAGYIALSNASIQANTVASILGGNSGVIVTTSQSNCTVGSTNGGQNGANGIVVTDLTLSVASNHFNSGLIMATTCSSYTSPSGNYTWETTGVYYDTLVGAGINGCDSLFTIDLTVGSIDTSVANTQGVLTANMVGQTYQWLDCSNGFSEISGATAQSFTPTQNGSYAVVVTTTECSDTSNCHSIGGLGLLTNTFESEFTIYPNPTDGQMTIDLGDSYKSITVIVRSVDGKLISEFRFKNKQNLDIFIEGATGYYFVEIFTKSDQSATVKVLKNNI